MLWLDNRICRRCSSPSFAINRFARTSGSETLLRDFTSKIRKFAKSIIRRNNHSKSIEHTSMSRNAHGKYFWKPFLGKLQLSEITRRYHGPVFVIKIEANPTELTKFHDGHSKEHVFVGRKAHLVFREPMLRS